MWASARKLACQTSARTFAPGFAPLIFHSYSLKFVFHFPFKITHLSTFLNSIKYFYFPKYSKLSFKVWSYGNDNEEEGNVKDLFCFNLAEVIKIWCSIVL
jgi:hypothetical protein